MARSLPVGQPLGYLGIKEVNPPDTYIANRAPTSDDYRYDVFDEWLDSSTNDLYKMSYKSGTTAIWVQIGDASGVLTTLSADDGGTATPTSAIIALTGNNGLETTATGSTLTYQFTPVASGYTGSQIEFAQSAIQTTDATTTDLITIDLAEGEMVSLEARINAFRSDYTESLIARIFTGARRQTTGNVSIINSNLDIFEDSAGAPIVAVIADIVNQELTITFTGEVGKTYNVVASYNYHKTLTDS